MARWDESPWWLAAVRRNIPESGDKGVFRQSKQPDDPQMELVRANMSDVIAKDPAYVLWRNTFFQSGIGSSIPESCSYATQTASKFNACSGQSVISQSTRC
jgi:hypothetical protein